jgi:alanine dehydrogenase
VSALRPIVWAGIIEPEWVRPGAHVSSVGYYPPNGEFREAWAVDKRLIFGELFDLLPTGCFVPFAS